MPAATWQFVGKSATLETPNLAARVDPENPRAGLRIERLCGEQLQGAALFAIALDPISAAAADAGASPVECFIRGNDLVATYAETVDRPFRAQIYWRLIAIEDEPTGSSSDDRLPGNDLRTPFGIVELIASVQTSLLDLDTALTVCTTFGQVESWQLWDATENRPVSNGQAANPTKVADFDRSFDRPAAKVVVPDFNESNSRDCCLIRPAGSLPSYIEMVHPTDFRQTTFEWMSESPPVVQLTHRLFAERLEKGVILRSRIRGLFVPRNHAEELARSEYRRFALSEVPLTA